MSAFLLVHLLFMYHFVNILACISTSQCVSLLFECLLLLYDIANQGILEVSIYLEALTLSLNCHQ